MKRTFKEEENPLDADVETLQKEKDKFEKMYVELGDELAAEQEKNAQTVEEISLIRINPRLAQQ